VIELFDADAFGTNAATVSYLPSAGIDVAPRRRKRGATLIGFL
jgi:hypothetical protein